MSTVSQNSLTSFHRSLRRWYDTHGRKDLPWRNVSDPYPIYISEIMLQQTQVATVLERFYFQFLKRFPTLTSLAKADRDDVLKAWQGLGYYQRARNLHEAAKRSGGSLPDTIEGLINLPGIGKNTAHAVAAFAFGKKTAVMEANVKRVLCRIFALARPSEAELWEKATLLLDKRHSFDYNQAMMDIGATICTKRAPKCSQCPASKICKGKDSPESYPTAIARKIPPVRKKHIILPHSKGKYFATPRSGRFLHGLYHFIESDSTAKSVSFQKHSYALAKTKKLGDIRQQYSHFTLEASVHIVDIADAKGNEWYSRTQLERLPMSMAERKILALL